MWSGDLLGEGAGLPTYCLYHTGTVCLFCLLVVRDSYRQGLSLDHLCVPVLRTGPGIKYTLMTVHSMERNGVGGNEMEQRGMGPDGMKGMGQL